MRVSLRCFGLLKDHLPAEAVAGLLEISVRDEALVKDAVEAAGLPPDKVFAILVDGAPGKLDQPLFDGSEVTLMPQFTGGSD